MFKFKLKRAVIGRGKDGSAVSNLRLPNGEYAVILDREVYRHALRAADKKFSDAVRELSSDGLKTQGKSAA